ncbi:MAG: DUF72 domain-containing protein [Pseudomonadota bacterium]|nr:DUF72 domain-containing protein [Pseudomonadota bacterium]
MQVWLGTGGYSNADWCGLIYPEGCKKNDYLEHYAAHFRAVELNSTFYAIAGEKAFAGMLRKSAGRVRFSVKLHQDFSHRRNATADLVQRMRLSPQPLRDAGVLAPFLLQFPYSFPRTAENRRYLAQLVEWFAGELLAVEFRHISWHVQDVQQAFRRAGLIWVSVDYPQLAGMPISDLILTQRIGYVRLHGRNDVTWWDGISAAERHDYRYTEAELQIWADRIIAQRDAFDQLYVYFENTTKGHALHNLPVLRAQLQAGGLVVH